MLGYLQDRKRDREMGKYIGSADRLTARCRRSSQHLQVLSKLFGFLWVWVSGFSLEIQRSDETPLRAFVFKLMEGQVFVV